MKASELMIGDWVLMPHGPEKAKQIEIQEVSYDLKETFDCYPVTEIQPIPLTPEILVANGFKSTELYRFILYQLGKESFSIAYDLLLKNLCAFTKTVKAGCRPSTTPDKSELSIQIQYVHELQQAMRLIGLRDLADNFVIEKGGPKCQ